MTRLEVRDLSAETINEQLGELQILNSGAGNLGTVTIDLSIEHEAEPFAGALFAQAMLQLRHDRNYLVHLPQDHLMISSLVRSGIASALSRWGERIQFDPAPNQLGARMFWNNWTPAARVAMAPMFGAPESPTSLFGPTHALFINPHLLSESEGPAAITMTLRRWLTQVVAPHQSPAAYEEITKAPLFTVDQLVRNVSEHAITTDYPSVDSMVSLQVERAAGHRPSLRITVLDTGAGLTATLRPKLGPECGEPTDTELLASLLRGELEGWGRGRGFGLATIAEMVNRIADSSLEVWSGGCSAWVAQGIEARPAPTRIPGTVASASFPLPRL